MMIYNSILVINKSNSETKMMAKRDKSINNKMDKAGNILITIEIKTIESMTWTCLSKRISID